mmetsp:Transcript_15791/g.25051  ORF Transcript_15791/g.25051 Transcript_15791/m.25051 type:complete len:92 (-) Transcript_15791:244-519(-)
MSMAPFHDQASKRSEMCMSQMQTVCTMKNRAKVMLYEESQDSTEHNLMDKRDEEGSRGEDDDESECHDVVINLKMRVPNEQEVGDSSEDSF